MFVIRRGKVDDVPTLLKLAKMVHFINLPPDKEIIDAKVTWARNCFLMAADADTHAHNVHAQTSGRKAAAAANISLATGLKELTGRTPLFLFVLEELETSGVIGTCQIISAMGGPGAPNVSLQLSRRDLFSESLQMGVTHTVAKIHLDETSPTEIGGLILQPSFRGHRRKLGRLLSLVRFHFMGLHRELFSQRVLAEMMGPITIDGHNPFWDYCTRCFINLSYEQADRFCQQTKEFLLTLFPREEIYLTLINPEARSVVGTVGPETMPAKRMLENLGFKYHNRIDPFDGGPHLEAQIENITVVRDTDRSDLAAPVKPDETAHLREHGIVSVMSEDGDFRAVECDFARDRTGRIIIDTDHMHALEAESGAEVGFTPLSRPETWPLHGGNAANIRHSSGYNAGAMAMPSKPAHSGNSVGTSAKRSAVKANAAAPHPAKGETRSKGRSNLKPLAAPLAKKPVKKKISTKRSSR